MKIKTIICLLAVLCMAVACDKENGKKPATYNLYITGADKTAKTDGRRYAVRETAMTAKEVLYALLDYADAHKTYYNETEEPEFGYSCGMCRAESTKGTMNMGLSTGNVDTTNTRLVFRAGNLETLYHNGFINAEFAQDLVIVIWDFSGETITEDTIAYVPNAQRRAAYEQIKALWDLEEWDEMYEIFENGLQFVPCTGAEYRELKARGEN